MDERPAVWVGHLLLHATDPRNSAEWWGSLGMRSVYSGDDIAILEMRGGTHLLIFPAENPPAANSAAPFDLMVDDVDAMRADCEARGMEPTALTPAPGEHQVFQLTDPDGYILTVYSTHVMGPV